MQNPGDMPVLEWLLEKETPEVRYLALRDLLRAPENDPELSVARKVSHQQGTIAYILEKMAPEGYWQNPGAGYSPKYRSTVWSLILLAQLGANISEDERIQTACNYFLQEAMAPGGQIAHDGKPSGTIDCLQGNMAWALLELGCTDARLEKAFEWMARTVTGEGMASIKDRSAETRYYAYKCGPCFACGANNRMPCAWGAVKVMLAFGNYPVEKRTALIQSAIRVGADFLLNGNPAKANYPNGANDHPSRSWWKFGFPVFYVTDVLQIAEALVSLGYGRDPRLQETLELIRSKQDNEGRWNLEYDYAGKTWKSYGKLHEPNKWVTLRALRVLEAAK